MVRTLASSYRIGCAALLVHCVKESNESHHFLSSVLRSAISSSAMEGPPANLPRSESMNSAVIGRRTMRSSSTVKLNFIPGVMPSACRMLSGIANSPSVLIVAIDGIRSSGFTPKLYALQADESFCQLENRALFRDYCAVLERFLSSTSEATIKIARIPAITASEIPTFTCTQRESSIFKATKARITPNP
jgi:hypothetical protein